jgi:hypothetical protein
MTGHVPETVVHDAENTGHALPKYARSGAHANWRCDIDFLLTDKGMRHVIEKTEAAA